MCLVGVGVGAVLSVHVNITQAFLFATSDVLNILNPVIIKVRYYKLVVGLSLLLMY